MKFPSLTDALSRPTLSLISAPLDPELATIGETLALAIPIDGRGALEARLCELLAVGAPATPRTLDLIGHTASGTCLLSLGDWHLDPASAAVRAFFRELADHEVLPRLGIHKVRLLGSLTARTAQGRAAIAVLSGILRIEVWGTPDWIYAAHFDAEGYVADRPVPPRGLPVDLVLDIDRLPTEPATTGHASWPVRLVTPEQAQALLALVDRRAATAAPGLLAQPTCELELPSVERGGVHHVQVLLDHEFVRVYPDGRSRPGRLYPTTSPTAVRALVAPLVRG